jgi:Protein of unknown function (DUF3309)
MLPTILIVLLVLLLTGALPTWPYSARWAYAPARSPRAQRDRIPRGDLWDRRMMPPAHATATQSAR